MGLVIRGAENRVGTLATLVITIKRSDHVWGHVPGYGTSGGDSVTLVITSTVRIRRIRRGFTEILSKFYRKSIEILLKFYENYGDDES